jgi:hypothetical protein
MLFSTIYYQIYFTEEKYPVKKDHPIPSPWSQFLNFVLINSDIGTTEAGCDKVTGKCICSPNYAGETCNECAVGFYNFPSCLPCNCDEEGSRGTACTLFGSQPQCNCKEGRGGSRCDQCAPGYYKYPDCIECQCDEAGSLGQSCDPNSGRWYHIFKSLINSTLNK